MWYFHILEFLYVLLSGNFHHNVSFYNIELLHLVKTVKYKTTFETCLNFLHVILKSLK